MEYTIQSYMSGTTWINNNKYKCGLHIGYFDLIKADEEIKLKGRGEKEKFKFASGLCKMLNEANENIDQPFQSYMCSIDCGLMDLKEDTVIFTDCLFGSIKVECLTVTKGGWLPTAFPEEIVRHLKYGFENIIDSSFRDK